MSEKTTSELEKIILSQINSNPIFIACEVEGVHPDHTEQAGLLEVVFLLSDILAWTGMTTRKRFKMGGVEEKKEILLLSILDNIAMKGLIEIYKAELTHDLSHRDFRFKSFVGTAKRTLGCTDVKLTVLRLYSENRLTKKEMTERNCLVNLSEIVKKVRKDRDADFKGMMGSPSTVDLRTEEKETQKKVIEAQKKAIEAEEQYRKDIHTIAEWIKEEEKK